MKKHIFNIVLCMLLVLSLCITAGASTLDTTNLMVNGNTVIIGAEEDAILTALHESGKTAKIAIPMTYAEGAYYVVKDDSLIVTTEPQWDAAKEFLQFPVPGAGTYVITAGTPSTLDQKLMEGQTSVALSEAQNTLAVNHTLQDGTVIQTNGNAIQGTGKGKTLTARGSLQINQLNGVEKIQLDAGDRISFDAQGNASVIPGQDNRVGYGSFRVTRKIDGREVTHTYFLVAGEKLIIDRNGKISGNTVFAPGKEDAKLPVYEIHYEAHDNVHAVGESGSLQAHCNGLFAYYTRITLTAPGSSTPQKLAEKVGGKDITASGIKVSSGSTVLTMESSFLNNLNAGTYTLTFHYADGATATASVLVTKTESKADHTNPKTGDPMAAAFAALIGSGALLTAMWFSGKKRIP